MIRKGSPKELFLTTRRSAFASIQLATGDEIKKMFNADGTPISGCRDGHKSDATFLNANCHSAAGVKMIPLPGGRVELVCSTCHETVLGPLQAAPRPTVEWPFVFCDEHGKQISYIVCQHVLGAQKPEILVRASEENHGGNAHCFECNKLMLLSAEKFTEHKDKFSVVCAGHLNDLLGGNLEQLLTESETRRVN
jgi:hypothetical protein